jgi:hypothetical protein
VALKTTLTIAICHRTFRRTFFTRTICRVADNEVNASCNLNGDVSSASQFERADKIVGELMAAVMTRDATDA